MEDAITITIQRNEAIVLVALIQSAMKSAHCEQAPTLTEITKTNTLAPDHTIQASQSSIAGPSGAIPARSARSKGSATLVQFSL